MPAFAHTQPPLVSVIRTPAVGAHDPCALREHQLDHRRVLVELGCQLPGALAGLNLGEQPNPPLDL